MATVNTSQNKGQTIKDIQAIESNDMVGTVVIKSFIKDLPLPVIQAYIDYELAVLRKDMLTMILGKV
jgi:hypothetical protein